jgi:DNA invertase Pin-like site-specific DNA recombinase
VGLRVEGVLDRFENLHRAGCEQVYTEIASGTRTERPVLGELLKHLRAGDVLIVWKLDRLGRSLRHLVELVADLLGKGVGLQSLNDPSIPPRRWG